MMERGGWRHNRDDDRHAFCYRLLARLVPMLIRAALCADAKRCLWMRIVDTLARGKEDRMQPNASLLCHNAIAAMIGSEHDHLSAGAVADPAC